MRISTGRSLALAALVVLGAIARVCPAGAQPPGTDIYIGTLTRVVMMPKMKTGYGLSDVTNVSNRRGYDNQPCFAPDESYLLYTSIDSTEQADIYRYVIADGRTERVTTTPESEYSPTIMPGGERFSTVRVEADGAQRLWSFALDGTDPRLVLTRVDSIGYHAWVDGNTLALFVLGEPHTLRIATVDADTDRVVARDIGRSLQTIPDTRHVSFVQQTEPDVWWLRRLDVDTGAVTDIAPRYEDSDDYLWTPLKELVTLHGGSLHIYEFEVWREIEDVYTLVGPGRLTRLAVSPNSTYMALVRSE